MLKLNASSVISHFHCFCCFPGTSLYGTECVHSPFSSQCFFNLSVQLRKRLCASTSPPFTASYSYLSILRQEYHHARFAISGPTDIPLSFSIHQFASFAADESWARLTLNIREIQHQNAHKLSFDECYKISYQLVVNKHGQMLYNGLRDLVIENLNRLAEETILPAFPSGLEQDPMQQSQERERLLKAVHKVWSDHTDCMYTLSHILKYMVRPTTRILATNIRMYVLRTSYM